MTFKHSWFSALSVCALLLLLGGRLTAYITPGEFLGTPPVPTTSASSAASAVLIPVLPGPIVSSAPSSILLPILPLPTISSTPSSVLLPILPLPTISASSHPSSPSIISSQPKYTSSKNGGGGGNDGYIGVRPVPRYPSKQSSLHISSSHTLKPAAPVSSRAPFIATVAATSTVPVSHYWPTAAVVQPDLPVAVQTASAQAQLPPSSVSISKSVSYASSQTLHTGAEALPSSGFPYGAVFLLTALAGFLVLRSVRRMEDNAALSRS